MQGILNACKGKDNIGRVTYLGNSEFSWILINTLHTHLYTTVRYKLPNHRKHFSRLKLWVKKFGSRKLFWPNQFHYGSRSSGRSGIQYGGWEVSTSIKNVWYSKDVWTHHSATSAYMGKQWRQIHHHQCHYFSSSTSYSYNIIL